VIAYSGYTLEQLKSNSKCSSLLDLIDVLIDGPYIQELNDGVGLRGSNNQHIIAFTNRLDPYLDHMDNGERKIQYILDNNGAVSQIGIPRTKRKLAYE
jgi:anaerobic ribonucleoside-triphosphate reductase activating protein